MNESGRPKKTGPASGPVCRTPTLPEVGIDHTLPSRAKKLAAMEKDAFEQKASRGMNHGTAGQGRPSIGGSAKEPPKSVPPTLAEVEIDKKLSSRTQKLAAMDEALFEQRVAAAKRQAVSSVEMTAAERAAEKKECSAEREAELAARQIALPAKRYGVVLADREWSLQPYSHETGMDRATARQVREELNLLLGRRPTMDRD